MVPEVLEGMAQMNPETAKFMKQTPLYGLYIKVNWETLFTKLDNLLRQDYDWSQEVASIKSHLMIAFADAVRMEHIKEFFALFGGGLRDAGLDSSGKPTSQLAIVSGATRYNICSFHVLADLVAAFRDTPVPDE